VPVEDIFRGDYCSMCDITRSQNKTPPVLGDRIVNLTTIGVPFGLKGTVVSIHSSTGFIEV